MIRADLPGADLVEEGLRALKARRATVESLLVSVASPRLQLLGVSVPQPIPDAELKLYALLAERYGADAHGKYNALVRRMVSFQRALACAG